MLIFDLNTPLSPPYHAPQVRSSPERQPSSPSAAGRFFTTAPAVLHYSVSCSSPAAQPPDMKARANGRQLTSPVRQRRVTDGERLEPRFRGDRKSWFAA